MKRILALLALMTAASFVHAQQDAKFYYDRSNSYYNKKEYDKAIADFSEALWLNTNHANAYRNLYASRHTMYGGGGGETPRCTAGAVSDTDETSKSVSDTEDMSAAGTAVLSALCFVFIERI